MQKINFRRIENTDTKILYHLLKERLLGISHKKMPTFSEHKKFVENHPYASWFLILESDVPVGTFYIQMDNSIGLNFIKASKRHLKETIKYINNNFEPKGEIKSKVPPYFFINVPYFDLNLSKLLIDLDFKPIQISYKFPLL